MSEIGDEDDSLENFVKELAPSKTRQSYFVCIISDPVKETPFTSCHTHMALCVRRKGRGNCTSYGVGAYVYDYRKVCSLVGSGREREERSGDNYGKMGCDGKPSESHMSSLIRESVNVALSLRKSHHVSPTIPELEERKSRSPSALCAACVCLSLL